MWLWERRSGLRGLLRATSTAVLAESSASFSPAEYVRLRSVGRDAGRPKLAVRIIVSLSSSVSPSVRLVSTATILSAAAAAGGSVWMAISVRSELGRRERSSVEMQTSTISEPSGGNMTWDRPLREESGVPEDRDEAEEKESEPWEDGATPLATGG